MLQLRSSLSIKYASFTVKTFRLVVNTRSHPSTIVLVTSPSGKYFIITTKTDYSKEVKEVTDMIKYVYPNRPDRET